MFKLGTQNIYNNNSSTVCQIMMMFQYVNGLHSYRFPDILRSSKFACTRVFWSSTLKNEDLITSMLYEICLKK